MNAVAAAESHDNIFAVAAAVFDNAAFAVDIAVGAIIGNGIVATNAVNRGVFIGERFVIGAGSNFDRVRFAETDDNVLALTGGVLNEIGFIADGNGIVARPANECVIFAGRNQIVIASFAGNVEITVVITSLPIRRLSSFSLASLTVILPVPTERMASEPLSEALEILPEVISSVSFSVKPLITSLPSPLAYW